MKKWSQPASATRGPERQKGALAIKEKWTGYEMYLLLWEFQVANAGTRRCVCVRWAAEARGRQLCATESHLQQDP